MITHLKNNIYAVFTEEGFSSGNCIYIDDDPKTVIDSAAGKILSEIDPSSVDILINSHHHIDHIRGNNLFTGATILASKTDHASMSQPLKLLALEEWHTLMADHEIKDPVEAVSKIIPEVLEPWPVDDYIDEGTVIELKHTALQVFHTPGHTEGHLSFFFPEEEILFTGDYCLTKAGPWYGDPETSIDDFISSVERLVSFNPSILVTGHIKEALHDDIAKNLLQYRDKIFTREKNILHFLKNKKASIDDIASQFFIYENHPTPLVVYWEKAMVKRHLERLMRAEKIVQEGNCFIAV